MSVPLAFLSLLLSCDNDDDRTETANKAMEAADTVTTHDIGTLCYLATNEAKNRDTLSVKLHISDEHVGGSMMYQYFEKDKRAGTLTGTKKDGIIKAEWTYMQEGLQDSMDVVFKLEDGRLQQKTTSFDKATGREYTPEDAPFTRVYEQTDCRTIQQ